MRIRVINPNASEPMTATIAAAAREAAPPDAVIETICNSGGPAAIEGHSDEVLAAVGVLGEAASAEQDGVDAAVIACFGDPGLDAAREQMTGPVIGIAEAAMHAAAMVARRFSIVTTLERTVGHTEELVRRYGFERACASVLAADIPVLDLEYPDEENYARILVCCRTAVERDRAEAIVLGCAGMADLCRSLGVELGVPVVDGVSAAVGMAQSLVRMDVGTSKRSEYAAPLVRLSQP